MAHEKRSRLIRLRGLICKSILGAAEGNNQEPEARGRELPHLSITKGAARDTQGHSRSRSSRIFSSDYEGRKARGGGWNCFVWDLSLEAPP